MILNFFLEKATAARWFAQHSLGTVAWPNESRPNCGAPDEPFAAVVRPRIPHRSCEKTEWRVSFHIQCIFMSMCLCFLFWFYLKLRILEVLTRGDRACNLSVRSTR